MDTIIEGKITKRENGCVTVNKIVCKLSKEDYVYTHIGDTIRLKLGWFKRWKVDTIRFKNPLHRYLIGVSPT